MDRDEGISPDTLTEEDRLRMRLELAKRSRIASFGFLLSSSLVIIEPIFARNNREPIRFLALLAFSCGLTRLLVAGRIIRRGINHSPRMYALHFWVVLLGGFGVSLVSCMGVLEHATSPVAVTIAMFLMTSVAGGAMGSLSADPKLHRTYFAILVGMPSLTAFYVGISVPDRSFVALGALCLVFFAYLLLQSASQYRDVSRLFAFDRRLKAERDALERALSELRQAQKDLVEQRARSEFSAKLASLGEMAGGIAHEINNPLAIIDASAEHVQRFVGSAEIQPSDQKAGMLKGIERIKRSVTRITRIISGLRTFSRQGEHDPLERVSIREIVSDTLEFCRERFRTCDIELVVSEMPEAELLCRPTQISQVLLNLLNNALDAVNGKPGARKVELSCEHGDGWVELAVADSGDGVAPEIAQKIFEPFFTTKGPSRGTGLGLSISRSIMEEHQGALLLRQGQGGAQFVMRFPKASSAASALAAGGSESRE